MKKFTFLVLAVFLFLLSYNAGAQQTFPTQRSCGTNDWVEAMKREYPGFQAQYEASERKLGEAMLRAAQNQNGSRTAALNVNIPIVFHVVLTAAQQANLTDAMIMAQLSRLNLDFAGMNADSANVPSQFQAVRGHSGLQFCLAKRTPTNGPTTGIVRVTSTTVSAGPSANDPVKSTAAGGSSAWDPTKYFNVWLCNFSSASALGYASFPIGSPEDGGWGLSQQGVAVLAQSVPGGTAAPFNGGRTLTHEAGHYFWLRHITGDSNCGNDFPTTESLDDTPQQGSLTSGCPGAAPSVVTVATGCASSPNPPGKMFQNYMDYTDDACYSMFTIGQVLRAEQAVNTFRPGYLTSNGCQPLVLVPDDARISAILSPANNASVACSPLIPQVTIANVGSNALTSATIEVILNGASVGTQAWTGNLASGATTNVTLTTVPISPIAGANTLTVQTTVPNGNADGDPSNDATTITFTRTTGVAFPLVQGFESATYPPTGWTETPHVSNSARKWLRVPVGNNSGFSIKADFWNWGSGTSFNITSPYINVTGNSTVTIAFDVTHRPYPGSSDRLQVQVSNDCGANWTTVYNKTSTTGLNTTTGPNAAFTPASSAEWRTELITLTGAILTGGPLQARWVATSAFGNNIYVDNINIDKVYDRDLRITAIAKPGAFECGAFQPVVTVRNNGAETVTAYEIVYSVDGGAPITQVITGVSLAPGASVDVTLTTSVNAAAGAHSFSARTNVPTTASGTGDQNTSNDAMSKSFQVRTLVPAPLTQGFETTQFPGSGWSVLNPNNNVTWIKRAPGFGSDNSAFIDNYSQDLTGQLDWIQSPAFSLEGAGGALADSVIITWDLAHQNYPGLSDELSIRTSNDCGNNFANVLFARSGPALAGSAGSNTAAYTAPAASHWQHLRASAGGFTTTHLMAAVRNRQGFGNNIFLDNINIEVLFKRDLKVISVDKPLVIECSGNFSPKATVRNNGVETITAFNISYRIDNGPAQTTSVTGVSLARNASMEVTLTPPVSGLATGQHTIKVYSAQPVTASGTGDQLPVNDTLSKGFGIAGTVAAPLTETFEGGTFPPANWAVGNPDGSITWSKASVGNSSNASAYMRNYVYDSKPRIDELYSPVITYSGVDSVQLSFDLSAVTKTYPGTTAIEIDTLEVLITKDCGNTFTSIWKKWGEDLQTINDPNYPQTVEFIPSSTTDWRNEVIDLTTGFTPNGPIQIVFRNTNNFENNIYVDNVNLKTRVLPANLKAMGYLILPNPFTDQFTIWHLQTPTTLRYVTIYNSAGQLVWKKEYNGGADKQITVDLTGKPAGMYVVNLGYTDRSREVQVKVIKN